VALAPKTALTRGPYKISISSCRDQFCSTSIAPFGDAYEKIGTIQRRLAWPLHKDDTLFQSGRPTGLNIYFFPLNCLRKTSLLAFWKTLRFPVCFEFLFHIFLSFTRGVYGPISSITVPRSEIPWLLQLYAFLYILVIVVHFRTKQNFFQIT
jgi:hypothetical protein